MEQADPIEELWDCFDNWEIWDTEPSAPYITHISNQSQTMLQLYGVLEITQHPGENEISHFYLGVHRFAPVAATGIEMGLMDIRHAC